MRVAYSESAAAWQAGPARIYDKLADDLVGALEEAWGAGFEGALVLDLGAGTGAASRAVARRGGNAIAVDVAIGMLTMDAAARPPAAAADAERLPFATGSLDAVVAAFSLNHLNDPTAALREAARVLRSGGGLVVGAYAGRDSHPAREVTEGALAERGWRPPAWYEAVRRDALPRLATAELALRAAARAGLSGASAIEVDVAFPELSRRDLVESRLGMAQVAPFVTRLSAAERESLVASAVDRLGDGCPLLVRSVIVLTYVK